MKKHPRKVAATARSTPRSRFLIPAHSQSALFCLQLLDQSMPSQQGVPAWAEYLTVQHCGYHRQRNSKCV